jgi:hypothetical protein
MFAKYWKYKESHKPHPDVQNPRLTCFKIPGTTLACTIPRDISPFHHNEEFK